MSHEKHKGIKLTTGGAFALACVALMLAGQAAESHALGVAAQVAGIIAIGFVIKGDGQ